MIDTLKLRRAGFWLGLLSMLPHILCCALPVTMALISLGTTVGLGAALAGNPLYRMVDSYHLWLLSIAIAVVALTGLVNLVAWRIDCRRAAASSCAHDDCTPRKRNGVRLFWVSLCLLFVDIGWFALESRVLGLHQGAGHEHSHDHDHSHGHAE